MRSDRVISVKVRYFCILFLAGIFASFLYGLGAGEKRDASRQGGTKVEVHDSYDRRIILNSLPERIVSCAPNMTEIVFYLGGGDRLVGRTDWCTYPPEAKRIESIGGLQDPNIEKIIQLNPDLVLASSHFQKETLALLESVQIPVFVGVVHSSYKEVFDLIRKVGRILGREALAEQKVKELEDRIETIQRKVSAVSYKPKVYYMISFGDEGDYTAGADTHIAQLIRWAGGRNVGDSIEGWRFSVEGLFQEDPDIILVGKGSGAVGRLKSLSPYRELRAVKDGRVYEVDNDRIDRMGPRNVEGLEEITRLLHPELF
jgi:iron complex transport system substrate-binding protein